jgi:hypothetical protein
VEAPLVVRGASGTSNPGGFGAVDASPNPGNPPFELPLDEPDDPDDPDEELEAPLNPDRPPPNPLPLEDGDAGADDGFDDELAGGPDDELDDPPAPFAASRAAFRFSIASIIFATGISRDMSRPASRAAPSRKYRERPDLSDGSRMPLLFSSIRPMKSFGS